MVRGTTPTLKFKLPFQCCLLTKCRIDFVQRCDVVLEKTLNDCSQDDKTLIVTLTEEETLKLDYKVPLEIQLRLDCSGDLLASEVITIKVGRILKEGRL